jgi:hypothetical protein
MVSGHAPDTDVTRRLGSTRTRIRYAPFFADTFIYNLAERHASSAHEQQPLPESWLG